MKGARRAGFRLAARTPLAKYLYHRYDYSFSPRQLGFLVECLDRTADVEGVILEVGCAYGHTTVFLNRHLDALGDTRRYVCVDTFSGFTVADAAFEEQHRGKKGAGYERHYADASLVTFQRTMANNGVTRVEPIQGDIKTLSLDRIESVSFCLIDVDLYLPVKAALERITPLLTPGGVIVVDDCQEHFLWDGALQAYEEFSAAHGIHTRVVEGQFGLIGM